MNLRRQHKLSSLGVCFFLVMFCVSGVLLNHSDEIADCEVSRAVLPPFYRYEGWNGGLLRGTTRMPDGQIAVYGRNGIWLTDSTGRGFADYNAGLPEAAHHRNIRALVKAADGTLFAVATTGLYRRGASGEERVEMWQPVELAREGGEALSDAIVRGDSLIVVGRSALYVAERPWNKFERITLAAPAGEERLGLSAFRAVWLFHSGQLFGLPGILVADAVALIMIFLCVTGLIMTLLPRRIRRRGPKPRLVSTLRRTMSWHSNIGLYSIALTLIVCISGWCLRPPVLIALATAKTKLAAEEANPWHDRLRMIRYYDDGGRWLLSTSEGFYELKSLDVQPQRLESQPPVSVMGLNVFERSAGGTRGEWLVGSFSGLFVWNTVSGDVRDYFTGEAVSPKPGPPFGRTAVSGYSDDFGRRGEASIVTFDNGVIAGPMPAQPAEFETLPMSLANFALEIHTGRIYFGNAATWFFVFIAGAAAAWSLITGLLLAVRRRRGKKCRFRDRGGSVWCRGRRRSRSGNRLSR